MRTSWKVNAVHVVLLLVAVALAAGLRYTLLDFKSVDFLTYTRGWYSTLKQGGFSAFAQDFSNYNVPYLYLLYIVIRFVPALPGVIATKVPSLLGDFVLAWLAFRIVRLAYPSGPIALFGAFAILFAPTVVLNSAMWGQADALYTTALVACLYFVLIRQDLPGMVMFGIAIAFKAQAIFLAPLLVGLALKKELRWRYFLVPPAIMLIALLPAWMAGRSLLDLLMIYPSQAGQYESLAMHAPSLLALIPDSGKFYPYFYGAGFVAALAGVLGFWAVLHESAVKLTPGLVVQLATISVMLTPFLLPKMHERYFYPADVLAILLAFYRPRYAFAALGMTIISFFAYQPALFGAEPVPMAWLALGVLALLVLLVRGALLALYPAAPETPEAVELST